MALLLRTICPSTRPSPHVPYQIGSLHPLHPLHQSHIDWYTKLLGMKLLRFRDIPEGKYSNAFLGYNTEDKGFALEVGASGFEGGVGVSTVGRRGGATLQAHRPAGAPLSAPPRPTRSSGLSEGLAMLKGLACLLEFGCGCL